MSKRIFFGLLIALLFSGSGLFAQDGRGLGLVLREVFFADLEEPARFGGEEGPLVDELLLLVADSADGSAPVTLGGAPDSVWYVDGMVARILSFDAERVVFVVPAPDDPGRSVLWRLDPSDTEKAPQEDGEKLSDGVAPFAQATPEEAKALAALARRGARPAIEIGPRLGSATRERIAPDDLSALGLRLQKDK